ncbi:YdhR family protein [Luteitalea sp.]
MEKLVLHMRLTLNVPADVVLERLEEPARAIAATAGLLWKVWLRRDDAEIGGVYLFADRRSAEAYLNGPLVQAVRNNPAVTSVEARMWDVEASLSALTRAPLNATGVTSSGSGDRAGLDDKETGSKEARVERFVGQVVTDLAASMAGVMTNLGHKLGLYRAMAAGPVTSAELAARTNTDERSIREWLDGQVAGGYLTLDQATGRHVLPPEHALVLADPDSPVFLPPAFDVAASLWHDEDRIAEAFRTGKGLGWHQHHDRLFSGTEAFFRSGYRAHLTRTWIPALEGVATKLSRGGRVADVGCGHGASTILMAQAYPGARFVGIDYHEASVQTARARAREAGVADRVLFETATAEGWSGGSERFDLVCFMDALHDMGDPLQAARRAREQLADGGTLMLVEPFAHDSPEQNVGPVARLYYAASAGICTQHALAQGGRYALGAQAGLAPIEDILKQAGFGRVRVATSTPFNLVIEARA